MILTLAWRNLWRSPRRTSLGLLSITAVGFMLGLLPALMEGQFNARQNQLTQTWNGYAQLQHPDYNDSHDHHLSLRVEKPVRQALDTLPEGVHWSERVTSAGVASSATRSLAIMLTAEDSQRAPAVARVYRDHIVAGRFLRPGPIEHAGEAVIGAKLAQLLQVGLGDALTLMVTDLEGSMVFDRVRIVGLVKSNWREFDRQYVSVDLKRYEDLMSLNGRRHAVVIAGDAGPAQLASQQLARALSDQSGAIAVRDWTQMFPAIASQVNTDRNVVWVIFIILFLIVSLAEANSVMMSTLERRREFGMVMALGVSHRMISRAVWLEYLLLAACGTALGMGLAAIAVSQLHAIGITIGDPSTGEGMILRPQFRFWSTLLPPLSFIGVIALATLIPVARLRRLEILEAMRTA